MRKAPNRAVFLDRDGVLIEDSGSLVRRPDQLRIIPGVPTALADVRALGFLTVVVTNQTVVARGMVTERELGQLHTRLQEKLRQREEAARIDAFYVCPHHPNADLPAYRMNCACRKPKPGMLLRAERDLDLDLSRSIMVGDRPSDIAAGQFAGCRTVLVESGRHADPPIESGLAYDPSRLRIDLRVSALAELAAMIPALFENSAGSAR